MELRFKWNLEKKVDGIMWIGCGIISKETIVHTLDK